MSLDTLTIKDFRNIESLELKLSPGFNQITGPNGAGKTSILEAIYVLSRGRSFRSSDVRHQIRLQQPFFEVTARTDDNKVIGMRKSGSQVVARFNQQPVTRLSEIAEHLPVFAITPNSHQLLEGVPDIRRRFLDWGLFHVEHSYWKQIQLYNRILKQRNAALKMRDESARHWDQQLIDSAATITSLRDSFIEKINLEFQSVVSQLMGEMKVNLSYSPGWDSKHLQLLEALNNKLSLDQERGFTSVGPHRCDLKITNNNRSIKDTLSRGQQKVVAIALIVAQVVYISSVSQKRPVLLIDDIPSELDSKHLQSLISFLDRVDAQKVITSVQPVKELEEYESLLFHVEHGTS
ncbi:hypothetical protein BOW16_04415 [Solemya velum gill symbiont]|uniref:DNA replication/repair protein RecF n=1 Tax=Solemya velum gill symbiont TaxID=2340 RepID=UPI00099793BF|nr:DNA replication/repair protein RecF [Solemya velum gill symbiont]OOY52712.1 hypothetical protein BOV97_05160 [Solemya velum gill symbiont]OOY65767.1 hypothetical protein BOW05_03640 [Solemya velum gill symbiont]OOY67837.1 hypothetical protein BOW06_05140 [Solemya velum gill symbiont]OOY70259.1 hypothetical protein BOW07_04675 [Solemya velum gill symbiont]OOY80034.1 hypothetical protein BOW11_05865 [Solemya velum gill symbiont]